MTDKNIYDEWVNLKTENFNTILSMAGKALKYSLMYGIIGFSGAGKTTAFQYLLKDNKNVIYLKLDKTFRPRDFYVGLLRLSGILDYGYDLPIRFLAEKLARTLNSKKEKTLLIIDDAGRFTVEMMEYFQQVRDETSSTTGIILAGTKKFKNDFDDWVKREIKGIPELSTRISEWIILKHPSSTDLKNVASKNGVMPQDLDRVVKGCTDFRTLYNRIITLRISTFEKSQK